MQVTITPERPCLPVNAPRALAVLVRLRAPKIPQAARKPLNLCLVIDRSGSTVGGPDGRQPVGEAQSGGESEEGGRPAPLGRVRGEGRGLAIPPAR